MHRILTAAFGLAALSTLMLAQSLPPYQQIDPNQNPNQSYPNQSYPNQNVPPPAYQAPRPSPNQMSPQMLGEMLRTAATFNEMVRSMNLNRALGPDVHAVGPDGRPVHSMERTAETIGAGAGAGAALGAMSRNPNGVMIGALIGGAGGLIVDQILKQQEKARAQAAASQYPQAPYGQAPYGQPAQQDHRGFAQRP